MKYLVFVLMIILKLSPTILAQTPAEQEKELQLNWGKPKQIPTTTPEIDNNYNTSIDEMCAMLEGKEPLSFKRAVFLSENAFYNGKLDWKEFCNEIEQIKIKINKMIVAKHLQQFKTAGNWAIFTYLCDSIPENIYQPYQYDFENFMGDKDYQSGMVSSLIKTKKGNCHSLPYLYKILADEINVEAFIATAPMHCYIKHKDEKDVWWNLELTTGTFSRTSFIMETFNVSDEGMASGLYMKGLSEEESVALCLDDALCYYDMQTGIYFGDMVRKAYTAGLKISPNSLLQLAKVDDEKYTLDKAMEKKGIHDYSKIKGDCDLEELENNVKATKADIKKMGYTTLTSEQYREKVQQVNTMKLQNNLPILFKVFLLWTVLHHCVQMDFGIHFNK